MIRLQIIRNQDTYGAIFDTIGLAAVTNILGQNLSSVSGSSYNGLIPPVRDKNPIPAIVEHKFTPYNWASDKE